MILCREHFSSSREQVILWIFRLMFESVPAFSGIVWFVWGVGCGGWWMGSGKAVLLGGDCRNCWDCALRPRPAPSSRWWYVIISGWRAQDGLLCDIRGVGSELVRGDPNAPRSRRDRVAVDDCADGGVVRPGAPGPGGGCFFGSCGRRGGAAIPEGQEVRGGPRMKRCRWHWPPGPTPLVWDRDDPR